jgi:uncharacterized RDD family membrane protein YckC
MEAADYRFAGFWWRVLAALIDSVALMVAGGILSAAIGLALGARDFGAETVEGTVSFLSFFWQWLYFALFESSAMRATPGKAACGLIVVGIDGSRISFGRATGRYFAKIISALILMIGFLMAGWTRRKQALHDMIAGTLVLKLQPEGERVIIPADPRPIIQITR